MGCGPHLKDLGLLADEVKQTEGGTGRPTAPFLPTDGRHLGHIEQTISAPAQQEPPPFNRVMTPKGYLGKGFGMMAGYAIGFFILVLVVLVLLFLIFAA